MDRMAPEGAGGATARGRVLLVDDEPLFRSALARILRPEGHELLEAERLAELDARLSDPQLDLVLLDLFLGAESGLQQLARIKSERPELEVVIVTGHASVESAVSCMREGAFDYLEKPFDDIHRVRATVARAIERRRLVTRNRELEAELQARSDESGLLGASEPMRAVLRTIGSLRHNESTVLIQGESGTGKEMVARAVHAASPRRERAFVPVDCGALPETIIESELFGHEKGAFTGAVGAPGLFRVANGGTLFLDEIGEIPLAVQAKLLRALQQKEVRPLGATAPTPVDIRVICATNRDLAEMVNEGSFRKDLYYRLNVVRLDLVPLRERRGDVPLLARHFLEKHRRPGAVAAGFAPDALHQLEAYPWPGNVRELENAIESALALASGDRLRARDLPLGRSRVESAAPSVAEGELPLSLDAYECRVLERALQESGGDATEAARRLGIGRSTFYRKLARHGVDLRRAPSRASLSAFGTIR